MKRYEAKRAVIIGGTSGMGLATAKMMIDEGARVLVTGRSQGGLDSAQIELGQDALVVSSDARSLTDLDALATRVKAEFDTIDLLFVNAGFSIPTRLESVTEAIYDEMFNLNAKGPFFAVQKLAPLINRGGSVVLTTSIANVKGMPGQATYGAAKAALRSFARALAAELLPQGIRVNAVTPGPIDTGILDKAFPDKDAAAQMRVHASSMVPMKRFGTSNEVAKAALFLASTRPSRPARSCLSTAVGLSFKGSARHFASSDASITIHVQGHALVRALRAASSGKLACVSSSRRAVATSCRQSRKRPGLA